MELKSYYAQDKNGETIPGAYVYLYQKGTTTMVEGIEDAEGNALSNPFQADEDGLFQVAAPDGVYDLRVTSTGRDNTIRIQFLDASEAVTTIKSSAARAESEADRAESEADRAETAFSQVVDGNAYPSLPSALSASLADGTRFAVWTPDDEADNYVMKAGQPKWLSKNQAENAITRNLRAVHSFPVDPTIRIDPLDAAGYGGRSAPGRKRGVLNLLTFSSGVIPAVATFGGTITPRFGAGESGGLSQRVEFSATDEIFRLTLGRFLEDGDWVVSLKVKSSPGAGNQIVRFGIIGDPTDESIDESAWVKIKRTLTSAGGENFTIGLQTDGTSIPDVLIDEARLHRDDGSVDQPIDFGAGSAQPDFALAGSWPMANGVIGPVVRGGILKSPSYPARSQWDGYTILLALRRSEAPPSSEYVLLTTNDSVPLTTTNAIRFYITSMGAVQASPVSLSTVNAPDYCNNEMQLFAIRAKPGSADIWHWGVEMAAGSPALPGIDWSMLRFFGNSETSLTYSGDFAGAYLWDSHLSDDALRSALSVVQKRLEALDLATGRGSPMLLLEGDSRSAVSSSFQRKMFQRSYTDGVQMFGGSFSQSGDGIVDVENDAPKLVRSINNAISLGRVPIVTMLIGVNDNAAVISDPDAYFGRIETLLDQYKSAGAKVVCCTELPIGEAAGGGTGSDWEIARASLRNSILTSPIFDAVADIGDPSTPMGDPDSVSLYPDYWEDGLHPSDAGHDQLAPRLWDAIRGLINA